MGTTSKTRKITTLTHALPVEIIKRDGSLGIFNKGKTTSAIDSVL